MKSNTVSSVWCLDKILDAETSLNLSAKCANSYYPGYQHDTRSEVFTSIRSSELIKYEEN